MSKVSVIVPARNERFLVATVNDLLAKATGELEIVVCLDGYWCDPPLPNDKRIRILHRGHAQGMRPGINAMTQMATGDYFLKVDAHTMWADGFDEVLKSEYQEDNWILTPRRESLEPESWTIDRGNPDKYPVDYEYLSYPFERMDDPTCGFHGTRWNARREARRDILLDTDMSSQGSSWFMSRKHWDRIGPMNMELFGNFYGESQEIGLQTQLGGGAMMRTKRTWYAHLRKSTKYGRGYALGVNGHRRGAGAMLRMCMLNQWRGQVRSLQSLIEEFAPVPGWPTDLDECFRQARETLAQEAA